MSLLSVGISLRFVGDKVICINLPVKNRSTWTDFSLTSSPYDGPTLTKVLMTPEGGPMGIRILG